MNSFIYLADMAFWYAFLAILIISLISVGLSGFFLLFNGKYKSLIIWIVAIAAGVMVGDALIHLIPEAVEEIGDARTVGFLVLVGIIVFYVFEKFIFWRHCHAGDDDHVHPFAYSNLFGDVLHNFIDGMLIGAAFMANFSLGVATSIAVGLHEIPQEFSDMGVLIHAGFSNKKAILMNLLTAFSAVLGLMIVFWIGSKNDEFVKYLLPITAGGFLYIAVSDLLPELKHHEEAKKSFLQLIFFLVGIGISMLFLVME